MRKPSLLLLTAAVSAAAMVANGVTAATPQAAPSTRLGNAIGQDMDAQDAAALRRQRALELREQAARATEARIQAELEGKRGKPGAAGGEAPPAEDAQYDDLARIYQAMKPKAAAVVFEQLDMEVQMKVAQRMRERSTAMIMAAMTPRGAAALSMALARKSAVVRPAASPAPRPARMAAAGR